VPDGSEPNPDDDAGMDAAAARDAGEKMDASTLADGGPNPHRDAATDASDGADAGGGSDAGAADAGSDAGLDPCFGADAGTACGVNGTCCSGRCVDLQHDLTHCGSCDLDCSGIGFCSAANACEPPRLDKVCENARLIMIKNGLAPDNAAGNAMAQAIATRCNQNVEPVNDDDQSVTGPDNRLLVGAGTTVVIGGGPAVQRAEGYLELSLSPVYFDNYTFKLRATPNDPPVASSPSNCEMVSSDSFVLQTIVAESGALVVSGYGFCPQATLAMSVYFAQEVAPKLDSLTETWWIVRWDDTNADNTPDANDAFTLLRSGS
jgi:hypothetical protein